MKRKGAVLLALVLLLAGDRGLAKERRRLELLVAVPSRYASSFNGHDTEQALGKLDGIDGYYTYLANTPVFGGYRVYSQIWGLDNLGDSLAEGTEDTILLFNECSVRSQANCYLSDAVNAARYAVEKHPDRAFTTPCEISLGWLEAFHALYVDRYGSFPFVAVCGHVYPITSVFEGAIVYAEARLEMFEDQARRWGVPEVWLMEVAWVPLNSPSSDKALFLHEFRRIVEERHPLTTKMGVFCLSASGYEPWSFRQWTTTLIDWDTGEPTREARWWLGMGLDVEYLPLMRGRP